MHFYFKPATDGLWANLLNWFTDAACTIPAATLPGMGAGGSGNPDTAHLGTTTTTTPTIIGTYIANITCDINALYIAPTDKTAEIDSSYLSGNHLAFLGGGKFSNTIFTGDACTIAPNNDYVSAGLIIIGQNLFLSGTGTYAGCLFLGTGCTIDPSDPINQIYGCIFLSDVQDNGNFNAPQTNPNFIITSGQLYLQIPTQSTTAPFNTLTVNIPPLPAYTGPPLTLILAAPATPYLISTDAPSAIAAAILAADAATVEDTAGPRSLCAALLAQAHADRTTTPGYLTVYKSDGSVFHAYAITTLNTAEPISSIQA
jgi:hypothetical protein